MIYDSVRAIETREKRKRIKNVLLLPVPPDEQRGPDDFTYWEVKRGGCRQITRRAFLKALSRRTVVRGSGANGAIIFDTDTASYESIQERDRLRLGDRPTRAEFVSREKETAQRILRAEWVEPIDDEETQALSKPARFIFNRPRGVHPRYVRKDRFITRIWLGVSIGNIAWPGKRTA